MARGSRRRRGDSVELKAPYGRSGSKYLYRTKTVPYRGEKDADRQLAAWVREVDAERKLDARRVPGRPATVGELLEQWYTRHHGDWSPNTDYQHRWLLDRPLAGLADKPLDVARADLEDFFVGLRDDGWNKKPLAVSTVKRYMEPVELAFAFARQRGYRDDNPTEGIDVGRTRKTKIRPPATGDVVRILEGAAAIDAEWMAFLFLDAETGARRGELGALRLTDIGAAGELKIERDVVVALDTPETRRRYAGHCWASGIRRGARPTLIVEKDGAKTEESTRTIALHPLTVGILEAHIESLRQRARACGTAFLDDGFLFPAEVDGSQPWRPDTWTHRFSRLRATLNLTTRLHDLRHFVATALLTGGHDLATVAGRLGHGGGGKTTLAIYGAFLKEADRGLSDHMGGLLAGAVASPPATEPDESIEEEVPDNVISLASRRRGA